MNMKNVIANWFAWLQSAVSSQEQPLSSVYSDGRQLWAGDGYRLHALDVALGQPGRVILSEEGLFQVEAASDIPALAATLPEDQPVASVVVSAALLRDAVTGQEGLVRLSLYGPERPLELAGTGQYALVMPVTEAEEWWFWRPEKEADPS
jgi:hypothetical protein